MTEHPDADAYPDATGQAPDAVVEPTAPAPKTGDASIDAALAALEDSAAGPLDEQVAAGEAVHRTLQGRLADLGGD